MISLGIGSGLLGFALVEAIAGSGKATGWLDLGIAAPNDENQLSDGDGCFVGSVPAAGHSINGGTHEGTFVTQTIEQNENIGIKIVADAAWTGYISALSITWGAS